jgi:hypothetical protein
MSTRFPASPGKHPGGNEIRDTRRTAPALGDHSASLCQSCGGPRPLARLCSCFDVAPTLAPWTIADAGVL